MKAADQENRLTIAAEESLQISAAIIPWFFPDIVFWGCILAMLHTAMSTNRMIRGI
jgi:hypothetical protein